MRVLVTGGAGYLGTRLVPVLLRRGHAVTVVDDLSVDGSFLLHVAGDEGFDFARTDIRDGEEMGRLVQGIDAVVHLAAIMGEPACKRDPDVAWDVNCEATRRLVQQSAESGVSRFLFASTASNYGTSSPAEPASEDTPLNPLSLYAETKVRAEEAVVECEKEHFAPTIFRLATLMGLSPTTRFTALLNQLLLDAAKEHRIDLYGPQAWRPFVHVRDVASAILTWLDAPAERVKGAVFNIGQGNYQKLELAEIVARHVPGTKIETTEASDLRDYCVSFAASAEALGIRPQLDAELAVRETATAIQQGLLRLP